MNYTIGELVNRSHRSRHYNGSIAKWLKVSLLGHDGEVCSILNLKKDHLATASQDLTIKIWNYESGLLLETLTGHLNTVIYLALLKDGNSLASISDDGTLRVWNFPAVFGYPNKTNLTKFSKCLVDS
jgi:WD40 repeat protein